MTAARGGDHGNPDDSSDKKTDSINGNQPGERAGNGVGWTRVEHRRSRRNFGARSQTSVSQQSHQQR